jgi:hypothetical protein
MEWVMNRSDQIAAEYLVRQVRAEKLESQQPVERPDRVLPLEAVAGFAVVAIVIFIFGWVL